MLSDEGRRHDLETALRGARLRVTPQRLAVLEVLTRSCSHPSAEDVLAAVNRRLPTVSRASVYNVLHSLCRAGLAREVLAADAAAHYEAHREPHHHFLCRGCGAIEDVPWETAEVSARGPAGGRVERVEVVFRGLCAACAATAC